MKPNKLLSLLLSSSLVLGSNMMYVHATSLDGNTNISTAQMGEGEGESAEIQSVTVTSVEEFKNAINNHDIEKIILGNDLTFSDKIVDSERDTAVVLKRDLILDGNGHTITNTKTRSIFDVLDAGVVVFMNLELKNVASKGNGRCIDLRNENIALYLENVTLDASGTNLNPQPLTIGGNYSGTSNVEIKDSLINAGKNGYGITTFNKVNINVNNTLISGYAGLYFKAEVSSQGSTGSKINLNNTTINGKGDGACDFGAIAFEDNGVELNINNSKINLATVEGNGNVYSALQFSNYNLTGESPVANNTITFNGDSEINTTGVGLAALFREETNNEVLVGTGVESDVEIPTYCLPNNNVVMEKEVDGKTVYVSTPQVESIEVSNKKFEGVVGETLEFTYKINPEDTLFELEVEDFPSVGKATIDKENNKVLVDLVGQGSMALLLKAGDAIEVVEIDVEQWFNVTFKYAENIDNYDVAYGELVEAPEIDTEVDGYEFLGWFNGDELYDFNTPVTSDLTLIAKWEKIEDTGNENPEVKPEEPTNPEEPETPNEDEEIEPGKYEVSVPELDLTKQFDKVVVGVADAKNAKDTLEKAANKEYGESIKEVLELGFDIEATLTYELLEAKDAENDYKLVEKYAKDKKLEVAQLLDISTVILVEGDKAANLTKIETPIKLRMALPKEYLKDGRTFKVLHVNNGKVEELETVAKDNYVEFETSHFSTFALSFTDKTTNVENPDTGVNNINLPVIGTVVTLIGACLVFFLRKKNK